MVLGVNMTWTLGAMPQTFIFGLQYSQVNYIWIVAFTIKELLFTFSLEYYFAMEGLILHSEVSWNVLNIRVTHWLHQELRGPGTLLGEGQHEDQ